MSCRQLVKALSIVALMGGTVVLPKPAIAIDLVAGFFQLPTPTPSPIPSPTPAQSPLQPELSIPVLEQSVYEQVNQYRATLGLPPLRLDARISAQARVHSQAMAQRRVSFGHVGLRQRALTVNRLVRSRQVAENVAYIFTHKETAKRAVQGWIKSPHHRPSLEGKFSLTGVGVAQGERGAFYFTQIYVRPR